LIKSLGLQGDGNWLIGLPDDQRGNSGRQGTRGLTVAVGQDGDANFLIGQVHQIAQEAMDAAAVFHREAAEQVAHLQAIAVVDSRAGTS